MGSPYAADARLRERRRCVWMALSSATPAPTITEIARALGVHKSAVWHDIRVLAAAGYVQLPEKHKKRALRVLIPLLPTETER